MSRGGSRNAHPTAAELRAAWTGADKGEDMNDKRMTHPSFGQITVHKTSGHGQRCYGSDLDHDHTIRLTIHESSYRRDLSHDWYSAGDTIIEIALTPLQWAEMLSSHGSGSGTPATITFRQGEGGIDAPPVYRRPHHEVYRDEAQETVDTATAAAREAQKMLDDLLAGASIKKGDLKAVQEKLRRAVQELQSNVPFVMKSFEAATERAVNDAKEEISAHHSRVVENLGLRALAAHHLELSAAGEDNG